MPNRIPYLPGDKIAVVGGSLAGTEAPVTNWSGQQVAFDVSDTIWEADKYVWMFKVSYNSTW